MRHGSTSAGRLPGGRGVVVVLAAILAPAVAEAATIRATARIFCPANLVAGTGHVDRTLTTPVTFVPCSGIRVVAMDADFGADDVPELLRHP